MRSRPKGCCCRCKVLLLGTYLGFRVLGFGEQFEDWIWELRLTILRRILNAILQSPCIKVWGLQCKA